MKTLPPYVQQLRSLRPFVACTDADLSYIDRRLAGSTARAGDLLTSEGEAGREMVVIVEGSAVIYVGTRLVARLGPGDVIGEVALLDHDSRTATAIAETDVVALVASASEFAEILAHVPAVARALLIELARRLRAVDEVLLASEIVPHLDVDAGPHHGQDPGHPDTPNVET